MFAVVLPFGVGCANQSAASPERFLQTQKIQKQISKLKKTLTMTHHESYEEHDSQTGLPSIAKCCTISHSSPQERKHRGTSNSQANEGVGWSLRVGPRRKRRKHPCGPRFACFAGSHMKCRATVGRPFASAAKEAAAPADRKGGRKNAAQRDA